MTHDWKENQRKKQLQLHCWDLSPIIDSTLCGSWILGAADDATGAMFCHILLKTHLPATCPPKLTPQRAAAAGGKVVDDTLAIHANSVFHAGGLRPWQKHICLRSRIAAAGMKHLGKCQSLWRPRSRGKLHGCFRVKFTIILSNTHPYTHTWNRTILIYMKTQEYTCFWTSKKIRKASLSGCGTYLAVLSRQPQATEPVRSVSYAKQGALP